MNEDPLSNDEADGDEAGEESKSPRYAPPSWCCFGVSASASGSVVIDKLHRALCSCTQQVGCTSYAYV